MLLIIHHISANEPPHLNVRVTQRREETIANNREHFHIEKYCFLLSETRLEKEKTIVVVFFPGKNTKNPK